LTGDSLSLKNSKNLIGEMKNEVNLSYNKNCICSISLSFFVVVVHVINDPLIAGNSFPTAPVGSILWTPTWRQICPIRGSITKECDLLSAESVKRAYKTLDQHCNEERSCSQSEEANSLHEFCQNSLKRTDKTVDTV
jgi:hypothetical protein